MRPRRYRGAPGRKLRERSSWTRWTAVVATLSVLALLTAACGSDDNGGNGGSAGEGTNASSKEACSLSAKWQEAPGFKGPGEPTNAAAVKGKSLWFIPFLSNNDSVRQVSRAAESVAKELGLKYTEFDPKADVTEMNRGVSQAVNQKADAIVLFAIPPAAVAAEVKKARANGIKVIDALNGDPDEPLGSVDAHVSFSYSDAGKARAQRAVCDTDGKLNGLMMTTNELTTSPVQFGALKKEAMRLCPDCVLEAQDIKVADWQSRAPVVARTAVQRNPKLNYLFPGYGDMAFLILPALQEAGALQRGTALNALNAQRVNLEQVLAGNISADIGNPQAWLGWAIVDQSVRVLNDQKPRNQNIPIRMFTQKNLKGLNLRDEEDLFGGGYQNGYRRLWGIE